MLNASDLKTYTADQVISLAEIDFLSVEKEGERRQSEAEKILAQIVKLKTKADKLMSEGEAIIIAAREARQ